MQGQTKNIAMGKESSSRNDEPIPPRFWWLKRAALGFGLLLVMLSALRFWWGHEAQRRIEAAAREAHARGEPSYPEDYRQAPVPDADNAAAPIEAALQKLAAHAIGMGMNMHPFFGWETLNDGSAEHPMPEDLNSLKSTIEYHQAELRLVRLARGRPDAAFTWPPALVVVQSGYCALLGQILITAANYHHATANDRESVEYVRDALMLTSTLKHAPYVSHRDLLMIDVDTVDFLKRIALELSISESSGNGASAGAVRSMIAALLDDRAMPAYARGPLVDDFYITWPVMVDGAAVRLFDPIDEFDRARVEEVELADRQATYEATFQAARAKWKDYPSDDNQSALGKPAHPLTKSLTINPPELSFGGYYKVLTERRVVAVMLAIQLYKFDHQNRLPASLSDLVPTYLPAVPRDPFDPSNGPIRYLPKSVPPILYSVGFNGKDDGGSKKQVSFLPQVEIRWHNEDVVYSLFPQSSFPTQDHQSNEQK